MKNGTLIKENNKNIVKGTNKISPEAKRYLEFCKNFGFKQLIQSPTRVTISTSSLIYHILTNTNEKKAQCGLINVGLSDHQIIFCTLKAKKKKKKEKVGIHRQISFRSFKEYSVEGYERALGRVIFTNYENYSNINKTYNFFHKLIFHLNYHHAPFPLTKIPIPQSGIKSPTKDQGQSSVW